jgi:hypothetical protein
MSQREIDNLNDEIRVNRPTTRKRRRREPQNGQERLELAIREGEANGRKWALRRAERGQLWIGHCFKAYLQAYSRAAEQVVREVEASLFPPIIDTHEDLVTSTRTGEVVAVVAKENNQPEIEDSQP